MTVRPSDLQAIPLFQGITDEHLAELIGAFERHELRPGEVLFTAGSRPAHLHLLVRGEVALHEPQATGPRFRLSPIAPIGELGAVTGLARNTTAETTMTSEVWRIGVEALTQFFEAHGDVAFPFYHNLLNIVADKVRRDGRQLEEVRSNLIRTQKGMKKLLDLVLESEETPLSKTVCETLEDLIERNRRIHYLVEPPRSLPSTVRFDGGATSSVIELSDGVACVSPTTAIPMVGDDISCVLVVPAGEMPVSGRVEAVDERGVHIKLDLLIESYATLLRDYLTRVQMLDFVV